MAGIDEELRKKYEKDKSTLVALDRKSLEKLNVKVVEANLVKVRKGLIRHDSEKLSSILVETIMDKKLFYDRKKIVEYFYLSERLKQNKKN